MDMMPDTRDDSEACTCGEHEEGGRWCQYWKHLWPERKDSEADDRFRALTDG